MNLGLRTFLLICIAAATVPSPARADAVADIARAYSRAAIGTGEAVGVGVAVIRGSDKPRLFTFGRSFVADGATPARRFRRDDLFEIGSVTKVFTTNLFGQAVYRRQVDLRAPLSNYATQLGTLEPLTNKITLLELADFTGGIADYAPLCGASPTPGCLPSSRPVVQDYTGRDFASYFRTVVPVNFARQPPVPAKSLPAPYYYSDYSVGLLGLLIAARNEKLSNGALYRWNRKLGREILAPLGMKETYLYVPSGQSGRPVGGYEQALARASVSGGQVSAVTLDSKGARYTQAPRVRLVGGGGTGAKATATLNGGQVAGINVSDGGSGYVTPATVIFSDGGSTTEAEAQIVIENGQVVAIAVKAGGAGYKQVPNVAISGGRLSSGRDATATAHLINGRVGYLTVDDPGAGYVPPLNVVVDPGAAIQNAVPIWAPAGALTTSLRDLTRFTRAALLAPRQPDRYPPALAHGFRIAETPHACTGAKPALATCPAGAMQSALSWAVQPADTVNGVPQVISKNGGLPGFSTQIMLMPDAGLAVVVMVNSRSPAGPTGEFPAAAAHVANDILYGVFAACGAPGSC